MDYRTVETSREVWAVIRARHPELVPFDCIIRVRYVYQLRISWCRLSAHGSSNHMGA